MLTLPFILGLLGMTFILIAFILDEFYKKFNQDTIAYNSFNIIGAGLLAYYSITIKGWPFLVLNVVWFLVAAYKLIKISLKK